MVQFQPPVVQSSFNPPVDNTPYTLSPPLEYCNEGVFLMFINKVLELYREACKHGLSVSLSINNLNGQESFSLATIPGPDLAGRPERRRRPRGGRRQRRRRQDQQECSAKNSPTSCCRALLRRCRKITAIAASAFYC